MLCAGRTLDRDTFLSAHEALEWGLIDEVVNQRPVPATAS